MLHFGGSRDGQETEAQGRRPEARPAVESPSSRGAPGQAEEDSSGARARSAERRDAGLRLTAVPPSAALPLTIGGLVVFAGALLVLATNIQLSLPAPVVGLLIVLSALGLVGFMLGLVRRAAGRHEQLVAANDGLQLEYDALKLQLADLTDAHVEAVAVLGAAPLHMLLIDPTYEILGNYSPELTTLFRAHDLRDENLLGVLRRVLPEPKLKVARDFLATLFDARRSDGAIAGANPLQRVEAMIPGADGSSTPHLFSFGFKRIYHGDAVERALMWVEDLTERVSDEQQARSAAALKARQLDLLFELVGVERAELDHFVAAAQDEVRAIDALLRAGDEPLAARADFFRERLGDVLQRVEAIESAAREVRFRYFVRRAGAYGALVAELAAREAPGGDDYLALVMEQSAFRAELEDLQELRARLDRPPAEDVETVRAAVETSDEVVDEIETLAQRLANMSHKEIVVDFEGFDTRTLSDDRREIVKDVLAELTRNTVEHGIEDPDARTAAGKPRAGHIRIRQTGNGATESFAFTFRDDGRGLDAPLLRERAVQHGLLEPERAATVDDSHLVAFIFAPELTSGMNVVKRKIVDECGGTISVDSEDGTFCEFAFVVPERA